MKHFLSLPFIIMDNNNNNNNLKIEADLCGRSHAGPLAQRCIISLFWSTLHFPSILHSMSLIFPVAPEGGTNHIHIVFIPRQNRTE